MVSRFQADHGLEVDGVVGPLTWANRPIDEPYCVDQYAAQRQLGTPKVWDGVEPMSFDCSGVALQAMCADGGDVPDLDAQYARGSGLPHHAWRP